MVCWNMNMGPPIWSDWRLDLAHFEILCLLGYSTGTRVSAVTG